MQLDDRQIVDKIFGRYPEGMIEVGIPEADLGELGKEIHEGLKLRTPLAMLYPQVGEVLQRLHKNGAKLALITASYREVVDAAITAHGLMDMFNVTVTGDEMKAQKPDPGGLLTALTALNITPDHAIMIGDSKKDILAGKSAGTDTMLFHPPEHEVQHDIAELQACGPTYTIRSWREFLYQL